MQKVLPAACAYEPGAQGAQLEANAAPRLGEDLPGGHKVQREELEKGANDPGAHASHSTLPV